MNESHGGLLGNLRQLTHREELKKKYRHDQKFNPNDDSFSISSGDIPSCMNSQVASSNSLPETNAL